MLKARQGLPLGPAKLAHQGRARLDEVKFIVTPEDSDGAPLAGQAGFIRRSRPMTKSAGATEVQHLRAVHARCVNNSIAIRPDNALVAILARQAPAVMAPIPREIVETLFSPRYPQASSVIASTAAGYVDLSAKLVFDEARPGNCSTKPAGAWAANGLRARRRPGLRALDLRIPQPQNKDPAARGPAMGQAGHRFNVAGDSAAARWTRWTPTRQACCRAWWAAPILTLIKSNYYPSNRKCAAAKGGEPEGQVPSRTAKLNRLFDAIAAETDATGAPRADRRGAELSDRPGLRVPIFEEPQALRGRGTWVREVGFRAVGRPSFCCSTPAGQALIAAPIKEAHPCHAAICLAASYRPALVLWAAFTASFILLRLLPGDAVLIHFP